MIENNQMNMLIIIAINLSELMFFCYYIDYIIFFLFFCHRKLMKHHFSLSQQSLESLAWDMTMSSFVWTAISWKKRTLVRMIKLSKHGYNSIWADHHFAPCIMQLMKCHPILIFCFPNSLNQQKARKQKARNMKWRSK